MKTFKYPYSSPVVTKIDLDSEISLILTSNPAPEGEPDDWSMAPMHFNPEKGGIG